MRGDRGFRIGILGCAFLFAASLLWADASEMRSVHLAIPDLQSPSDMPWLGAAVSEAVCVKLTGVDGITLLERRRIQHVLRTNPREELSPELLGCDSLLLGSVQISGRWENSDAKIRISARVVSAETGATSNHAAFVLDGTAKEIFQLENRLSRILAETIGVPLTELQVEYRQERNREAKTLFGKGLERLNQALGEEGETARGIFRESIRLFREAQKKNEGAFYARAHHYEGRARKRIAELQTESSEAEALRRETIAQFRKDAAEAAPAFFDLGRAYEENGEYDQAIGAYDEFLQWIGERSKVQQWRVNLGTIWQGGKVYATYCWKNMVYRNDWKRSWICFQKIIFIYSDENNILAFDVKNGKKRWETHLPGSKLDNHLFCVLHLYDRIFALVNRTVSVLDVQTGRVLATNELDLTKVTRAKKLCRANFAYSSGERDVLILRRTNWEGRDTMELVGLTPDTLKVLWKRTRRKRKGKYRQWILNEAIMLQENGKREIFDVNSQVSCPEKFSPELLDLLPFEGDLHGNIYYGDNVFAYLVRYSIKNGKLRDIWRIDSWREKPVKEESFDAVIEKHHMDGYILNAFVSEENLPEKMRVLGFDYTTGKARTITLPKKAFSHLRHPKTWQWYPRIFLQGDRIIVFENKKTLAIYRADESFSLLWRYRASGPLWDTPVLDRHCVQIHDRDENNLDMYHARLKPPAFRFPLSELDARYRRGVCYEKTGRDRTALAEYNAILKSDATHVDSLYRAIETNLRYGYKQAAWGRAEYFFAATPPHDPRRKEVWEKIIRANGVLLRVPYAWWKRVGILGEQDLFLVAYPKGLSVYNLLRPDKSWQDTSLAPSKCDVLAGAGKGWATIFRPCSEAPESEFVQYNLATCEKRVKKYPPLKAVHINMAHANAELRSIYSRRPALYQNRLDPCHFLLIHPQTMKIEGSFALSSPLKMKNLFRFPHSDEDLTMYDRNMATRHPFEVCSVSVTYADKVVLAGVPDEKNVRTFLVACYSRKEKKLLWEREIPMDKDTWPAWNSLYFGVRMYLVAMGNQVLIRGQTDNNWISVSLETGEWKHSDFSWDLVNAYYGNDVGVATQCLDESFQINASIFSAWQGAGKRTDLTGREFEDLPAWQKGGMITCLPIWKGGPAVAYHQSGTKRLAFYRPGKPESMDNADEQNFVPWNDGLLNVPPYTAICIPELDKEGAKGGVYVSNYLYLCRNELLYGGVRAWKDGGRLQPPEKRPANIPLHLDRTDTVKRFSWE